MTLALLIALPMGCPGFGNQVPDVSAVPDYPTWDDDVLPIMDAECNSCHGAEPYSPDLAYFRLDTYATVGQVAGGYDMRDRILARAVDGEGGYMPLYTTGVDEASKQTLERWVEIGAPETAADVVTQ